MKILWDSGNIGFGGCGINEWDNNVISELRRIGVDVTLIVDNNLSRRPKFKKWKPPEGGFLRYDGKLTSENYAEVANKLGPFDFQVGNHFTMYPVLDKIFPIAHDVWVDGRADYSRGIELSLLGLLKQTSAMGCTTEYVKQQITDRVPTAKVRVLRGGSKLQPVSNPVSCGSRPYIAYWGNRYGSHKNFNALLKTLPMHDLDLHVTGFLPPTPAEYSLVEELKATERVRFHVGLDDQTLASMVQQASMYVCPSKYEGMGMPAVEAMAMGVPVVVAPCAALPFVVGDCGTIAKSHKTKDLAEAINEVLSNPAKTEEKRQRGLEQAKLWTWENTTKTLISTLEML